MGSRTCQARGNSGFRRETLGSALMGDRLARTSRPLYLQPFGSFFPQIDDFSFVFGCDIALLFVIAKQRYGGGSCG